MAKPKKKSSAKSAGKGKRNSAVQNTLTRMRAMRSPTPKGMTREQFLKTAGVVAAGVGAAAMGLGGVAKAQTPSTEPLVLTPEHPEGVFHEVRIYRDEYSVPHIYSDTDYGLHYGLGYTHGQDRLAQYYIWKMANWGRSAELYGAGTNNRNLDADMLFRLYYVRPAHELEEMFDGLSTKCKDAIYAWLDGMNYFIDVMNAKVFANDPSLVPAELFYFGYYEPGPGFKVLEHFSLADMLGIASAITLSSGSDMTAQYENMVFAANLQEVYPDPVVWEALFNDTVWWEDSEASVTVIDDLSQIPMSSQKKARKLSSYSLPQANNVKYPEIITSNTEQGKGVDITEAGSSTPGFIELEKHLEELGAGMGLGSNFLAVYDPNGDAGQNKIVYGGGFQQGFASPPTTGSEVQLTGGESGYNIRSAMTCIWHIAGRKEHFNYSVTVGFGANSDWYEEEIRLNPDSLTGLEYLFKEGGGADPSDPNDWHPFEPMGYHPAHMMQVRKNGSVFEYDDGTGWKVCDVDPNLAPFITSTPKPYPLYWLFKVRYSDPYIQPLFKSLHGPLMNISSDFEKGYTVRKAIWGSELDWNEQLFQFGLANTFDEFKTTVQSLNPGSFNYVYAGFMQPLKNSNEPVIAYFHTGEFPLREPEGPDSDPRPYKGDPRFPRDGRGGDEWRGTQIIKYPHPYYGPFATAVGGTTKPNVEWANPAVGVVANWNNQPSKDFRDDLGQLFGTWNQGYWSKAHGAHRIHREVKQRLGEGALTVDGYNLHRGDVEEIIKSISSNYNRNDGQYYLKEYLLDAGVLLSQYPYYKHPRAEEALEVLRDWDLNAWEPVNLEAFKPEQGGWSGYGSGLQSDWGLDAAGFTIMYFYAIYLTRVFFGPDIYENPDVDRPSWFNTWSPYMARLLHILDYELIGYSGVEPMYARNNPGHPDYEPGVVYLDYFDPYIPYPTTPGERDTEVKMVLLYTLMETLDALDDAYGGQWDIEPRSTWTLNVGAGLLTFGEIGAGEWITHCDIISYNKNGNGVFKDRMAQGQSGFISVVPHVGFIQKNIPGFGNVYVDPHMFSQIDLVVDFRYKQNRFLPESHWGI